MPRKPGSFALGVSWYHSKCRSRCPHLRAQFLKDIHLGCVCVCQYARAPCRRVVPSWFSNCSLSLMRTPTTFPANLAFRRCLWFLGFSSCPLETNALDGKFLPNLLARTGPSLILACSLAWCLTALSGSAADLHSSKHALVKSFVHFNSISKCFLTRARLENLSKESVQGISYRARRVC